MSLITNAPKPRCHRRTRQPGALYVSVVLSWALIGPVPPSPTAGAEPIKVVTTLPVLKDLTEQVGGDKIWVKSLLTGFESPHTYAPKPSDLAAVRETRLFIEIGLGLEIWADRLLKNARPPDLVVVTTSEKIQFRNDRQSHPPSEADPHQGLQNPHIWLDPVNVKTMVQEITQALTEISPENGDFFQSNRNGYFQKLEALEREIHGMFEGIPNKKFVSHHPAWPYFAKRFGLTIAGDIQTQLGSEPSAKHMASLAAMIRREGIQVIVSEPQLNPKIPRMLSLETGARVVTLTAIPGGLPGTDDYLSMMRYNAVRLSDALAAGSRSGPNGNKVHGRSRPE